MAVATSVSVMNAITRPRPGQRLQLSTSTSWTLRGGLDVLRRGILLDFSRGRPAPGPAPAGRLAALHHHRRRRRRVRVMV
jgi:hypothetical protein